MKKKGILIKWNVHGAECTSVILQGLPSMAQPECECCCFQTPCTFAVQCSILTQQFLLPDLGPRFGD
eukprot:1329910-Rhodomonas_salina.6